MSELSRDARQSSRPAFDQAAADVLLRRLVRSGKPRVPARYIFVTPDNLADDPEIGRMGVINKPEFKALAMRRGSINQSVAGRCWNVLAQLSHAGQFASEIRFLAPNDQNRLEKLGIYFSGRPIKTYLGLTEKDLAQYEGLSIESFVRFVDHVDGVMQLSGTEDETALRLAVPRHRPEATHTQYGAYSLGMHELFQGMRDELVSEFEQSLLQT